MKVLAFDTSNQALTVALTEEGQLVNELITTNNKNHSTTLMPAIAQLMAEAQWQPADLDRIVVAQGPGSYTGLRIGVTTAKTLASTLHKELVGVSSLAVIAANAREYDGLLIPLFDARRQNVYAGVYRWQAGILENVLPDRHIPMAELAQRFANEKKVRFIGSDTQKFRQLITEVAPTAEINTVGTWDVPHGSVLAQLAEQSQPVSDIDAFLPAYLKKVEAEEKWLATHSPGDEDYVEKI